MNMNIEQNIRSKLIRISLKHVPWPQIQLGVSIDKLQAWNMYETNFIQFYLHVW